MLHGLSARYSGPPARVTQPDPVLTNYMQDLSNEGGFLAPQLCGVRNVTKDYVRWGKQDNKSLLTNMIDTLRTPGKRAALIPRPIMEWVTSIVQEDAVRAEFTDEDIENSVSPERPRLDAARVVLNVLQFAFELRVATELAPAQLDADSKTPASGPWATSGKIVLEVETEKAEFAEAAGIEANYIRIPRKKWPGIMSSDEIQKNPQNAGLYLALQQAIQASPSGFPRDFLNLRLLIGTTRRDTTPTGDFTPGFLWDNADLELDDTVHIGYSPNLDGQEWDGKQQTYLGCWQNNMFGAPFDPRERLDPNYEENKVHIIFSHFRRSLPEVMNPKCVRALTGM